MTSKIARDLAAEVDKGQIEEDVRTRLAFDLQSELDSGQFEADQRS